MSMSEELRDVEHQFRALVQAAVDERWQRDGRYSAKDILADVRVKEDLWKRMAEQLAKRAAVSVIQRQMKARVPSIHPAQEAFAFAKELPVPLITYKGTVVSTLRATADEYLWFSHWSQQRHKGTIRRSKVDKKELARIERFARVIQRDRGDDPKVTIEDIVRTRQERLEALRKQRKNKLRNAR